MAIFVLIHGAWHGGWCWVKLAPLLTARGHTVVAPDLPGHGEDHTPLKQVTLQAYTDRVCQVLDAQSEPVVLVGHSLGGLAISGAAEHCPERIRLLVFLAAFLQAPGQTPVARGPTPDSLLSTFVRRDEANGYLVVMDEGIKPTFYHDCSDEDVAYARTRLVPQALIPESVTGLALSQERFGRLPRVYIECLQDKAVPLAAQRARHAAVPCAAVLALDTGHSPFFAAPDALAAHLLSLVRGP